MRSLHILQVMECTIGGTRRHFREIAMGLALRGHRITVICSAERDPAFRDDMAWMDRSGVRVVELPMVRRIAPCTDLKQFFRLYRFLRQNRFDILHTHSSKAGVLGRLAGLAAGYRNLVHTPHTFAFAFRGHFGFLRRNLFLGMERVLGRHTVRMIDVSLSEREEAVRYGLIADDRLSVVENGIDPWPYRWAEPPDPDQRLFKDSGGSPRLGTVGLLNAAKGHHVLLHAFSDLAGDFPKARLAIVGEGELRSPLESLLKELGLEGRAFLAGYREDVPSLLKEMDCFVLPSLWEAMPYVLLEAMAAGVPVVATDVNGSRDIVRHGETGLLVPPDDPQALAAALAELLWNPARAESMARAALRRVFKEYSIEKMLDRVEGVYRDVLDSRRRTFSDG